jgi:hypothetical protein
MVRDPKQIVDQILGFLLFLTYNEVAHVQTLNRELDRGVLFLLHPFEPFKINHQDRWGLEYLNLLYGMLMHLASVTEPSVLIS